MFSKNCIYGHIDSNPKGNKEKNENVGGGCIM
jgi:hypothetical protein